MLPYPDISAFRTIVPVVPAQVGILLPFGVESSVEVPVWFMKMEAVSPEERYDDIESLKIIL